MTSLFSPFDLNFFGFCFSFVLVSSFIILNLLFKLSILSFSVNFFSSMLMEFFLTLKPKMFNKISNSMFLSVFVLIFFTNFLSVFSYSFPLSSQPSIVLGTSLGVWLSLIFFSLIKNTKGLLSHLIPEGTPIPLTIFLFLIEFVSIIIRPLTLMVRLVANILAGHLLLILLSNLVFNSPLSFFMYMGLNSVELLVALIQAYIFSTMIVLYFSEV